MIVEKSALQADEDLSDSRALFLGGSSKDIVLGEIFSWNESGKKQTKPCKFIQSCVCTPLKEKAR